MASLHCAIGRHRVVVPIYAADLHRHSLFRRLRSDALIGWRRRRDARRGVQVAPPGGALWNRWLPIGSAHFPCAASIGCSCGWLCQHVVVPGCGVRGGRLQRRVVPGGNRRSRSLFIVARGGRDHFLVGLRRGRSITMRSHYAKRKWKGCFMCGIDGVSGDVSLPPLPIRSHVAIQRRFRHLKPLADLGCGYVRIFHARLHLREVLFG